MKKLFYLPILFLGLFSCQKDVEQTIIQESQDSEIGVQFRETPCGGDLFCTKVSNSPSAYISGGGIGVVVNGQEYEFLPMELYDQSTGIVLKYNEQILVLHNGSNEYLSTKNSDIVLPRELGMLMNISFDDFGDRSGIASKIQTETGRSIQTTNGYPIIDITGVGNPDDGGPTVINVVECDYKFVSSVEEFTDEFFKEGGSLADKMLVEEAFNSCPEHDDGTLEGECNFCKNPRCLVDYLLGVDPNRLSDYSKELIVINYLRATFGLSEIQFNALTQGQENRDFAKNLYNLASDCNNYDVLDDAFGPGCDGVTGGGTSGINPNNFIVECISDKITLKIIENLGITDETAYNWIYNHPDSWGNLLQNSAPNSGFDICESTFNDFTSTGVGSTISLECNKVQYVVIDQLTLEYREWLCYELPDLCITVGQFEIETDDQGNKTYVPLGNNARKHFTTMALIKAQQAIIDKNREIYLEQGENATFLSKSEADALFKKTFEEELGKHISGVTISSGSCTGNISSTRPYYSFFGICLPLFCKC